jgi:hypothetical protein
MDAGQGATIVDSPASRNVEQNTSTVEDVTKVLFSAFFLASCSIPAAHPVQYPYYSTSVSFMYFDLVHVHLLDVLLFHFCDLFLLFFSMSKT